MGLSAKVRGSSATRKGLTGNGTTGTDVPSTPGGGLWPRPGLPPPSGGLTWGPSPLLLQVEHEISLTDGLTLDKPEEVEVCVLCESWATTPGS